MYGLGVVGQLEVRFGRVLPWQDNQPTRKDTGRYWLVLDGTGSVEVGTGWYLMVLCQ